MSSFSEDSSNCTFDSDDTSESSTDSVNKSQTSIPKQAVGLAPPQSIDGMFVSIKGGLLFVQNNFIAHSNEEFQGILRFEIRSNKWSEWISYPKGLNICAKGIVLDEKRQILYIFQENVLGPLFLISNPFQFGQTVIVNLTEKTFKTESNELFIDEDEVNENSIYLFNHPKPVLVGDVIYIYHSEKCLKWNIETNQVDAVLDADLGPLSGALYCDMQYVHYISIN